jgi:gas vesicle protein
MEGNQKFFSGVLVGALAGAALVIFLKSELGKRILSDLELKAMDLEEEMQTGLESAEEKIQSMLAKAKLWVEELEHKLAETQSP